MQKVALFFLTILFALSAPAQIVMTVQVPPAGMVQMDQLWNVVIINSSTTEHTVKLMLSLQNASSGQSVLTASTQTFFLGKGMKIPNGGDIQPVQYNYATAGLGSQHLPLGSYIACYSLYRIHMDASEKLAEECVRVNIAPLSPPLLVAPLDKSILSNGSPQFSWIAPAPLDLFADLNYDLVVTEILPGQSPAQAIQFNIPIYSKSGNKKTFDMYPGSFTKLDTGKVYGWQVTARNGMSYSASTEIWTFTVPGDSLRPQPTNAAFIQLKANPDEAAIAYVSDTLFVQHYSYEKPHEGNIRVYAADGTLIEDRKYSLVYGDNFIRFPLDKYHEKEKLYRFILSSSDNRSYVAYFTLK